CFPSFLLGQLSSLEETKPLLLWFRLCFTTSFINLANQLPLSLGMVVGVWVLNFRKFVTEHLPADFSEETRHSSTVVHMPVHRLGQVKVLQARDPLHSCETGHSRDPTARS